MRFSVYFDCILNEKNASFYIEIMISAAHMLKGMLPAKIIMKNEQFDQILYENCFLKVIFCIEQYDIC